MVAFEVKLGKVRELEALVEKQRALKRELRESSTQLVDPTKRAPSMTLGNKVIGRPKRSMLSNKDKSHKRRFAGPVLRRDPTAPEKLAMIMFCEQLCKEQMVEDIKLLRGQDRKSFEKKYHYPFFNVINWAGKKAMLSEFVGKSRIGKHGLRPCGLNGKNVFATSSGGLGARISSRDRLEPCKAKPLGGVYKKLKEWLKDERIHGHEVRMKVLTQRLIFQLEYERDQQLVLQEHNSTKSFAPTFESCREKLTFLQVVNPSKRQVQWIADKVMPSIGASTRTPNRLSDKNAKFDFIKCKTSWQTVDFFVDLVARGTEEELIEFVRDTEIFIKNRKSTSFVVVDQTALWLKLRGEERVVASLEEAGHDAKMRKAKRKWHQTEKERQSQVATELVEVTNDNPTFRGQCSGQYTTAGDKYRLTLVNLSGVEGWFNPSVEPRGIKKKGVLIVPCSTHCRLEDISAEGKWVRDWSHMCSDGTLKHYKQDHNVGSLMCGWRAARDQAERPAWMDEFLVWGQPRAWTDELISSWLVDHIHSEWGQAIVQLDCLGAQWSEPVLLQAWSKNLIWCPLAPDTTSYLQEPDTHEHSQLKSLIREVKSELHFQLEQERRNKAKEYEDYVPNWGPYEILYVAGEALKRFKQKHTRVPLQGLIRNNHLVLRPNAKGALEITPDELPYEYKIPPNRGIPPEAALDRLQICKHWVEAGERAPRPEWDALDRGFSFEAPNLEEVDEPADEEHLELDFRFDALELTDHQRIMMQKPEDRIKSIVYPEFVQQRAAGKRKHLRKNVWGNKFQKHFSGKTAASWRAKITKHGEEHLKASLAPKGKVNGKTRSKLALKKPKAKAKAKVTSTALVEVDEKVHEGGESGTALVEVDEKDNKKEAEAARKRAARVTRCGTREEALEHPFLKKQVRVVAECVNEGRRGEVTAMYKATTFAAEGENEGLECNIFSANGVFCEKLENLALVTEGGIEPLPYKLDFRRLKAAKRASIKHALEGGDGNLELIVNGTTLEQSTVAAILKEIELRFEPKETKIVIPSIATPWGNDEGAYEDAGGEVSAADGWGFDDGGLMI